MFYAKNTHNGGKSSRKMNEHYIRIRIMNECDLVVELPDKGIRNISVISAQNLIKTGVQTKTNNTKQKI